MAKFLFSFVFSILLFTAAAQAAGPYVVDDAGIVDPGQIQTEDWFSHSDKGETLGIADVAYQLLPHAEFTLLNSYDSRSTGGIDTVSGQVKYQWREGDEGKDVASSAVLGIGHDATNDRFPGIYAYVPSTWVLNDTVAFNADLGWQYEANDNRNLLTWGVGTMLTATKSWSFVGEFFNQNMERPGFQIGSNVDLVENLTLNTVVGHNITGASSDWVTAGIVATF